MAIRINLSCSHSVGSKIFLKINFYYCICLLFESKRNDKFLLRLSNRVLRNFDSNWQNILKIYNIVKKIHIYTTDFPPFVLMNEMEEN
ncbi:hypothetical protein E4414_03155 [Leptospira interrogans]|nr:hypothetical protein E4414_03155 [Leptospira interrogans]